MMYYVGSMLTRRSRWTNVPLKPRKDLWLFYSIIWLIANIMDVGTTVRATHIFGPYFVELNPAVQLWGWTTAARLKLAITVLLPVGWYFLPHVVMRATASLACLLALLAVGSNGAQILYANLTGRALLAVLFGG